MFCKRWWFVRSSWRNYFRYIKSFISHDETLKKNLKKDKLTTRDSRVVERKNTVTGKQEEAFNFLKDNLLNLTIIKENDIKMLCLCIIKLK